MKHSPLHDLAGVLELLEGIFVPDAEETWVEDDEFVVFATTFDSKSGLLGLEIKATERDVVAIRELIAAGLRNRPIAERYGVSISTIHLIRHERIWRHVA